MRNNFYSEPIAQMSLVNHTSFIKISGKQRWSYFLSSHSGASCDPKLYLFGRSYAALISEKRNRPRSVRRLRLSFRTMFGLELGSVRPPLNFLLGRCYYFCVISAKRSLHKAIRRDCRGAASFRATAATSLESGGSARAILHNGRNINHGKNNKSVREKSS
jgi:hypothetical protein